MSTPSVTIPSISGASRAYAISDPAFPGQDMMIQLAQPPIPPPQPIALGIYQPSGANNTAAAITTLLGTPPGIVAWYQDLENTSTFNPAQLDEVLANGKPNNATKVNIRWELDNYKVKSTKYANICITLGAHDDKLITFLKAAGAWNKPFMLTFFWEMTGYDYPWAVHVNGNTPGSFIDAWRHVAMLVRQYAPKALIVWCPSVDIPLALLQPFEDCYPGSQYVDIIGLNGYNKGTAVNANKAWFTFDQVFYNSYTRVLQYNKPILINEIGCDPTGGDKVAWITSILPLLDTMMPNVHGLIWFNNTNGPQNYTINDALANTTAFLNMAKNPLAQGTWS